MKQRPLKDWINIGLTLILYFIINPVICYFLFVNKHYIWFGIWIIFSIFCFTIAFYGRKIMIWFLQKKIDEIIRVEK